MYRRASCWGLVRPTATLDWIGQREYFLAEKVRLFTKIVAVGNGTKEEKMTVSVGDTVLYGKYAGTELKFEGQDYLIMRESDLLAIV